MAEETKAIQFLNNRYLWRRPSKRKRVQIYPNIMQEVFSEVKRFESTD